MFELVRVLESDNAIANGDRCYFFQEIAYLLAYDIGNNGLSHVVCCLDSYVVAVNHTEGLHPDGG